MLRLKLTLQSYYIKKLQKYHSRQIFNQNYQSSLVSSIFGFLFKSVILVIFGIIILLPFYFMINLALQTNDEATGSAFVWFPKVPQWDNFRKVLDQGYWSALLLTIVVTIISVITRTFFAMTVGYAFALKKWRFKNLFWWFFLSLLALPEVALLLGQYQIVVNLQWKESLWIIVAMFLPFVSSTFSAFMYKNAFSAIPDRTKEAAMIDGVGSIAFFFKVAIPMVKTTTLTVSILAGFAAWNSFTWPNLLLSSSANHYYVLSTWLFNVGTDPDDAGDGGITYTNLKMAGAILSILPMFLAYLFFRKKIMRAISSGGTAIKG